MVFDKTGTLTHGSPIVVKTCLFVKPSQCGIEMLLALTGTAENHSEHPIGLAITNYAKQVGIEIYRILNLILIGSLNLDYELLYGMIALIIISRF